MAGTVLPIGSTNPKTGTFQRDVHRIQGVTLVIPPAAGVTSVTTRRIVSLQQYNNVVYAVISPVAIAGYTIVGWGVLEEALQEGGVASIAPDPNNLVNGDTVVVLRYPMSIYMLDYDPSNVPVDGIATAYVDAQGRLSSSSAGSNLALHGSVFTALPGREMSGQLKTGTKYYELSTALVP